MLKKENLKNWILKLEKMDREDFSSYIMKSNDGIQSPDGTFITNIYFFVDTEDEYIEISIFPTENELEMLLLENIDKDKLKDLLEIESLYEDNKYDSYDKYFEDKVNEIESLYIDYEEEIRYIMLKILKNSLIEKIKKQAEYIISQ